MFNLWQQFHLLYKKNLISLENYQIIQISYFLELECELQVTCEQTGEMTMR